MLRQPAGRHQHRVIGLGDRVPVPCHHRLQDGPAPSSFDFDRASKRVDIVMAAAAVEESVTVTAESTDVLAKTRERYIDIARRMKREQGIEGLILGGTELPLLLRDAIGIGVTLLDTARLHVEAAVSELLSDGAGG